MDRLLRDGRLPDGRRVDIGITEGLISDVAESGSAQIDGVEVDGMRYGKIDANLERRTGRNQWIEMTLTEGKNREVRKVLEHLGLQVSRLIRTRYGPFTIGDLQPGDVSEIKRGDLERFVKELG